MAGIGSLDFHLNIIFLYASSLQWSGEQMGTITGEAQQCRVAGGQESLAIKQSPQLRKVQNPAIQNAFKGTVQRDRIKIYPWKKLNMLLS